MTRCNETPGETGQRGTDDDIRLSRHAPRVSLGSYLASSNSTALRVPAPTQDVPVSVQTVPQAMIGDRQALSVRQAIETASGVESSNAIPVDMPQGQTTVTLPIRYRLER